MRIYNALSRSVKHDNFRLFSNKNILYEVFALLSIKKNIDCAHFSIYNST